MAVVSPRASSKGFPIAPTQWTGQDSSPWIRRVAEVLNTAMLGKMNNVTTLTLTVSAASTTITDRRIGANTVITFTPTTANAAAELGAGTLYQTLPNATKNQAVITHANNAQADRTYGIAFFG